MCRHGIYETPLAVMFASDNSPDKKKKRVYI